MSASRRIPLGINGGPQNRTLLGYPVVIDQAWPTYTDGGTIR
jgi:hypothetical protein